MKSDLCMLIALSVLFVVPGESLARRNPFIGKAVANSLESPNSVGSGAMQWKSPPSIVVTGVMQVNGERVATATIEKVGNTVLRVGDKVILPRGEDLAGPAWFKVVRIFHNRLIIQLDDGSVINGSMF